MFLLAMLVSMCIASSPDTVVVCPKGFQPALARWIEYRSLQGNEIIVIEPAASAARMKQAIRLIGKSGTLKNLVIVGDVGAGPLTVPTDYRVARVNRLFGSEPEIATDNTYADLDDDGFPDLAIGRIPVDTPEQLKIMIDRIISYESQLGQDVWRRRINVVAGVGGFGTVIDKSIENTVKVLVSDFVPPEYDATMTYGSWTSPYCPDPRRFSETAIERLNEGCKFWVYVGHGNRQRLDNIKTPIGRFPVMDMTAMAKVAPRNGSPIAVFLACYTGAFDDSRDCIAESLVNQPTGPIAAICGTRVTMPSAMGLLSLELMDQEFHGDSQTLGEMMLLAKQRMIQPKANSRTSDFRDVISGTNQVLSPRPELFELEIQEHLQLFHLLGDPLLRLSRPESISIASSPVPKAGQQVELTGLAPFAGSLTVDVSYPRSRLRHRPIARLESRLDDEGLDRIQVDYLRSFDLVCVSKVIDVLPGAFHCELDLPNDVRGQAVARVFLAGKKSYAVGSTQLEIANERKVIGTIADKIR